MKLMDGLRMFSIGKLRHSLCHAPYLGTLVNYAAPACSLTLPSLFKLLYLWALSQYFIWIDSVFILELLN
jgi:hypothetical protein